MTPEVSIVIPYFNDVETTIGTIDSIYETIDIDNFEVVVVCDGGKKIPDTYSKPNMLHISHFFNLGVGQAFDTGVRASKAENIILCGADIRFKKNGWARRMIDVVNDKDKGVVCATCRSFTTDRVEYGADIIPYADVNDLTKAHPMHGDKDYKSVLQGKWRRRTGRGVYQIPCLMGTFYGIKRRWYERIHGFALHYKWGSLEPYMSLKSWRLGGPIYIDTDNEAMHIWRQPERSADYAAWIYNQILTASVVFGREGKKYADHLVAKNERWAKGSEMYADKYLDVVSEAQWIEDNAVISAGELEALMEKLSMQKK